MAVSNARLRSVNPYSTGNKVYGAGRSFPTMGPVDKLGYAERDAQHRSRRNAIGRRLAANAKGAYASADSLRKV
jgi:hypothetical protein